MVSGPPLIGAAPDQHKEVIYGQNTIYIGYA